MPRGGVTFDENIPPNKGRSGAKRQAGDWTFLEWRSPPWERGRPARLGAAGGRSEGLRPQLRA
ncbi:MAG: hypothetical protein L0312_21930, partial [Acidobacteria bacterium]|nr:hypothetical protein [Acidobacteriota bacterium]